MSNHHGMSDHQGNMIWGTIGVVIVIGSLLWCNRKSLSITSDQFGIGLAVISAASFLFGAYGYYVGAVSAPYATWLCFGGGIAGFLGFMLWETHIDDVAPPAPAPQLPTYAATPDIYGTSRAATREEAHKALGGHSGGTGAVPQSRYDYED